jgi:hypothetical protein
MVNKLWDIEASNNLSLNFMFLTTENKSLVANLF